MRDDERQAYSEVTTILFDQIMGQRKSLLAQTKLLRSFMKKAPERDYVEASILLSEQIKEQLDSLLAQIKLMESFLEEFQ